jgi:hypothetical protein
MVIMKHMMRSRRIASRRQLRLLFVLTILLAATSVHAIGLSTALFIPRNGLVSHPVSPLSIRDVGINIFPFLGFAGSISLYNINGLGVRDSGQNPIAFDGPATLPFYSLVTSVVAKATIPVWQLRIVPKAGVFGFYAFSPKVNAGVIDPYIANLSGSVTVDTTAVVEGGFGWGFLFGGSVEYSINDQFGVVAGLLYYLGSAPLDISGTYRADGGTTDTALPDEVTSMLLDFTGFEVILGINIEQ